MYAPRVKKCVRELNFGKLQWGDAGIRALAVVLPLCAQLTRLMLHDTGCGDAGVSALAEACVVGA